MSPIELSWTAKKDIKSEIFPVLQKMTHIKRWLLARSTARLTARWSRRKRQLPRSLVKGGAGGGGFVNYPNNTSSQGREGVKALPLGYFACLSPMTTPNEISSDERTRPIILTESRMCTKPNAAPPGRSRWLAPVNGPATLHCNVIHTFFALAPGISATFDINSNFISKLTTLIALSSIFAVCHNIYHLLKRFLELLLHNLEATSWKGGFTRKRLLFFYDMSFVLGSNNFPISCYFCS